MIIHKIFNIANSSIPLSSPSVSIGRIAALYNTSGSCIHLPLYTKLPGFDENLFIDGVDIDYCLAASSLGYDLKFFQNIYLRHTIGLVHQFKFGKLYFIRSIHAPKRFYYMVRNHFYILRKFRTFRNQHRVTFRQLNFNLVERIINNIIFNVHRGSVIKYMLKGILDYKRGKTGRIFE